MKTTNPFLASALFGALLLMWATVQPSSASASQDVLSHYLSMQSALARDSMKHVSISAQAVAEAVRRDETKSFPTAIANQAEAVAKAKNIVKARQAFKPLSESLIAHLQSSSAPPGTYYEVYCPIAKASWLQTGETVKNPYLGPRSATPTWGWACAGEVKAKFENASSKGLTP